MLLILVRRAAVVEGIFAGGIHCACVANREERGMRSRVNVPATHQRALTAIKVAHTLVWAFMAGCILALPIAAWVGRFRVAAILSFVILLETGVLAMNRGRCPLTDMAARFTEDRSPDFDIYLPLWLARHNKVVFGTLFLVNEVIALAMWRRGR